MADRAEGRTTIDATGGLRRVLVVEDTEDVQDLLVKVLERDGFRVVAVPSGTTALDALDHSPVDVVLLDVGLPDIDGLDVLRQIRKRSDVPIIILTARGDETDRVIGLELGADDYVVKPFSPRELVARVRAMLRRRVPGVAGRRLEFPGLAIDLETREVQVEGREVTLRHLEFELLAFLAQAPKKVFTREQLLQQVWGSSSEWQDPRTVTEHIRRVRLQIEPDADNPRYITTVRGVGYRFEP